MSPNKERGITPEYSRGGNIDWAIVLVTLGIFGIKTGRNPETNTVMKRKPVLHLWGLVK